MTTGMELVLSPGGGGGDAGSPFRNEDVREWSRVDRATGMLERARVETDRWQADTRDAKQSYGKVTDSRQRNSADGSLVQQARRQVEVFQSQGNHGRNFQVVRSSQWSSSRATDVDLHHNFLANDTMSNGGFGSPRLSLWRPSLADTASDLDRLSYLCRKLHDEAMSSAGFFGFAPARSPSPALLPPSPNDQDDDDSGRFEELEDAIELGDERLSSLASERRSNSNEDLPSLQLANGHEDNFSRDCRTRRSLQIPDNGEDKTEGGKARRTRAELIAERAKRFEQAVATTRDNGVRRSFVSTKTFTPIANNDFVKNDPMHPSKFGQVAKVSVQDNAVQNGHHAAHVSPAPPPTTTTRKANNKTVVHLRNAASPDATPPRCINVTAIKLEKDAAANDRLADDATTTTTLVNGTKPVKKVEFCKTEIHFAADSGKVNIVETDGKPPPTNKFRRRRRNHSLNSAVGTPNPQKSNLPVVHFGDTSYEKYIFGGGKVPPPSALENENKTDNSPLASAISTTADESNNQNFETTATPRWEATNGNKEIATRDCFTDTSLDRVLEHVGKFRGAHTTTVNFLSGDEGGGSNNSSKALAKVGDGAAATRGIRLQFASRSLSPIHSIGSSDDEQERVIRTTKITLHLPAPIVSSPRRSPMIGAYGNLESVRLVMNTMGACSRLLDSFCTAAGDRSADGAELWSLKLRHEADGAEDGARILDESRMIEDKPSSSTFTSSAAATAPSSPAKSQLLPAKDSPSDQVLTKVVTTHKPVVARVDEHPASIPPAKPIRLKNQTDEEKVKSNGHLIDDHSAKEHCDNASNDPDETPVYENIFDAVSDGAPLYENFHRVVKTIPVVVVQEKPEVVVAKKPSTGSAHRKLAPKLSSEGSNKAARSSTPKSEKERSSSRSRDNSIKRRKEGKLGKEDGTRSSQTKKSSSSSVQERKGTPTSLLADKNAVKTKKPVEVVYKTAVYNMKNEKLSKPTKSKEIKGPRLINELICGTKLKKPSDSSKKIIKTAIVSQSNSKKKEAPAAVVVNR